MERKVIINSTDDIKLCGMISEVDESNKIAILCHGIRGNKDERGSFVELVKALQKEGISSLRFDFRAHGESTGVDYEMNITKEIQDVETVINFVQVHGFKNIVILGASFGAGIVSLVDYNKYNKVKGLVSWYGATDLEVLKQGNLLTDENKEIAIQEGYYTSKSVSTGKNFRFGLSLFEEANQYKPYEALRKLDIPILFVHGNKDEVVPYSLSVKVSEMCKNSKLELIDGGIHSFDKQQKPLQDAIDVTVSYIKSITKDRDINTEIERG